MANPYKQASEKASGVVDAMFKKTVALRGINGKFRRPVTAGQEHDAEGEFDAQQMGASPNADGKPTSYRGVRMGALKSQAGEFSWAEAESQSPKNDDPVERVRGTILRLTGNWKRGQR